MMRAKTLKSEWMIWTFVVIMGMILGLSVPSVALASWIDPPDDDSAMHEDGHASDGPLSGPRARHRRPPPPPPEREARDEPDRDHRPPGERRHGFRGRGDAPHPGEGGRREFRRHERRESPEEIFTHVMTVLQAELPEWHERLSRMCEESPERCRRTIRKLYPMIREYESLKRRDPELAGTVIEEFKLEHELRELARSYRQAEDDTEARERLTVEIEKRVRRQFEIRLLRHESRLAELENRLVQQREKYKKERDQIDTKVSKRVKQIQRGEFRQRHNRGRDARGRESRHPPVKSDDSKRRRGRR